MSPPAREVISSVIHAFLSSPDRWRFRSCDFGGIAGPARSRLESSPDEFLPRTFRVVGVGKKIQVGSRDHSLRDESVETDDASPIGFLHENDRDGGHLVGLNERQQFEELVERAKPTGEDDERVGAYRKVKFSHGKVVKLKGQVRCRI